MAQVLPIEIPLDAAQWLSTYLNDYPLVGLDAKAHAYNVQASLANSTPYDNTRTTPETIESTESPDG